MAFQDLNEWIATLEKEGELARVKTKVNWDRTVRTQFTCCTGAYSFVAKLSRCTRAKIQTNKAGMFSSGLCDDLGAGVVHHHSPPSLCFGAAVNNSICQYTSRVLNICKVIDVLWPPSQIPQTFRPSLDVLLNFSMPGFHTKTAIACIGEGSGCGTYCRPRPFSSSPRLRILSGRI